MAVTIVTGGALGIGGATSRRLARRGDLVLINDIDAEAAEATRAEIVAEGGRCEVEVGDITDPDVVAAVAARAHDLGDGGIGVLVNNVGDFKPFSRSFEQSEPEHWQRLYEVNLWHVFAMTHAVLDTMKAQGGGAIVNVSTVEAFRAIPGHAVYSAFNAGVTAFTRSLAVAVGQYGIRVNAIAPDLINTPATPAEMMLRGRDPQNMKSWAPLARLGEADECAKVIEFLSGDGSSYMTGQTLPVDGGTLEAGGWFVRFDGKGWTNFPKEV